MDGAEKEFTAAYRKFFLMVFIIMLALFGTIYGTAILGSFLGGGGFLLVIVPILALAIPFVIIYFFYIKGGLYSKLVKSSVKMYSEALGNQDVYYKEHLKNKLREELKEELKREMLEEMKKKELSEKLKEELRREVP